MADGDGWIEETLHRDFAFKLKVERVLVERGSGPQHLSLIENRFFGRVLYLDGVLQTSERDEFVYHEMLTHLPIVAHGAVRDVLVIGGGDGGMLEEILKHPGIARATLVEIDQGVIDFCREHLPGLSKGAFDDPRTEVVIGDGARFVQETEGRFDLVIVDSTDPIGPGEVLFREAFYAGCKRILRPGGVLVTQNGVPFVQPDELARSIGIFRRLFADATCYLATVPGYVGGPMAFGWASDQAGVRLTPAETLIARWAATGIGDARYYRPEIHHGAFALPVYVADLVGAEAVSQHAGDKEMTTTYAVGDSDERPWGRWEVLAIGEGHVVKRITVNPGGKLSLQYHHHRSEHWVIVAGVGRVTRGEDQIDVPAGGHVHIEQGVRHRVENPGAIPVVFIEVQQGDLLDEDDIVRLEDVYGRS